MYIYRLLHWCETVKGSPWSVTNDKSRYSYNRICANSTNRFCRASTSSFLDVIFQIRGPPALSFGPVGSMIGIAIILQNLVQNYKQREVNLERKLLKLNSLREEQSTIAQMQKQLEEKTETVEILNKTIGSLRSESEVFREKIREDLMLKKQFCIL